MGVHDFYAKGDAYILLEKAVAQADGPSKDRIDQLLDPLRARMLANACSPFGVFEYSSFFGPPTAGKDRRKLDKMAAHSREKAAASKVKYSEKQRNDQVTGQRITETESQLIETRQNGNAADPESKSHLSDATQKVILPKFSSDSTENIVISNPIQQTVNKIESSNKNEHHPDHVAAQTSTTRKTANDTNRGFKIHRDSWKNTIDNVTPTSFRSTQTYSLFVHRSL